MEWNGFHRSTEKIREKEGRNPSDQSDVCWIDTGKKSAVTRDRTRDLQIFSLTLSRLSYPGDLITIHIAFPSCHHEPRSTDNELSWILPFRTQDARGSYWSFNLFSARKISNLPYFSEFRWVCQRLTCSPRPGVSAFDRYWKRVAIASSAFRRSTGTVREELRAGFKSH
jgi:hypothetical protein